MANSIAYVLSKNTYPDAFQANLIGVDQGTQIVYTTTSTLTTANVLYADSRLTQPIYGDGTSWYGVQLLTNTSVLYAITISESGVIAIGSGTTTTTAGPTTTTTAAPTTTTTTAALPTLYVDASSSVACSGTSVSYTITNYTYNGGSGLCNCVSLNSANVAAIPNGTFFVSDGTNVREMTCLGGGTTLLEVSGSCFSC